MKTKSPYRPNEQVRNWLLLYQTEGDPHSGRHWKARCLLCGQERVVREYSIRVGNSSHCRKCNPGRTVSTRERLLRIGDTVGWWTILEVISIKRHKKSVRYVRARCKCGAVNAVREREVARGRSKSCGCGRAFFSSRNNLITAERRRNESRVTSTGGPITPSPGPVLRAEGVREGVVGVNSVP